MISRATSSIGWTDPAPPFFTSSPGMPQTTAVDSASAMVCPPCRHKPRHGIGSVAAHAGQHNADQTGRVIVIERAAHQALDARMPGIVPLRRDRHGAQAGRRAARRPDRRRRGRYRPFRAAAASAGRPRRPRSAHCRSSRRANGPVKFAGMCCATMTGQGKSAGSCGSTMSSATGPPVDVPISTSPGSPSAPGRRMLARRGRRGRWRRGGARGTDGECARVRRSASCGCGACAAARTFSTRIGRSRSIASENVPLGLATKSTAPSSHRLEGRFGAFVGQRGDHHHRPRRFEHDPAQAGQPVHARHLDVERDDLRVERRARRLERLGAVARQADLEIALLRGRSPSSSLRISAESSTIRSGSRSGRCLRGLGLRRASRARPLRPRSSSCAGSTSRIIRPCASRFTTRPIRRICSGDSSGAGLDGVGGDLQHFGHGVDHEAGLSRRRAASTRMRRPLPAPRDSRSNRRRRSTIGTTVPRRLITPSMKAGAFGSG